MTVWFLDACGLINLYASGRLADLARRRSQPFLLVPNVVREAGWVFERQDLERGDRVPIDLEPLLRQRLVEVITPSAEVQAQFLKLAAELDDGEAMTIAAAATLEGAGVVTDDEAAIKYLKSLHGPAVTSSLSLLHDLLEHSPLAAQEEALLNIRVCARYLPGPRHPEIVWWKAVLCR